jgi:hypothetical protein
MYGLKCRFSHEITKVINTEAINNEVNEVNEVNEALINNIVLDPEEINDIIAGVEINGDELDEAIAKHREDIMFTKYSKGGSPIVAPPCITILTLDDAIEQLTASPSVKTTIKKNLREIITHFGCIEKCIVINGNNCYMNIGMNIELTNTIVVHSHIFLGEQAIDEDVLKSLNSFNIAIDSHPKTFNFEGYSTCFEWKN